MKALVKTKRGKGLKRKNGVLGNIVIKRISE